MDDVDYRGNYKAAVEEALAGGIGVYADYDQSRGQECFRILSGDRSHLLKFASREGITTGKVDTLKTLKSPKPLYQMMATGDDTRKIHTYLQRIS